MSFVALWRYSLASSGAVTQLNLQMQTLNFHLCTLDIALMFEFLVPLTMFPWWLFWMRPRVLWPLPPHRLLVSGAAIAALFLLPWLKMNLLPSVRQFFFGHWMTIIRMILKQPFLLPLFHHKMTSLPSEPLFGAVPRSWSCFLFSFGGSMDLHGVVFFAVSWCNVLLCRLVMDPLKWPQEKFISSVPLGSGFVLPHDHSVLCPVCYDSFFAVVSCAPAEPSGTDEMNFSCGHFNGSMTKQHNNTLHQDTAKKEATPWRSIDPPNENKKHDQDRGTAPNRGSLGKGKSFCGGRAAAGTAASISSWWLSSMTEEELAELMAANSFSAKAAGTAAGIAAAGTPAADGGAEARGLVDASSIITTGTSLEGRETRTLVLCRECTDESWESAFGDLVE